MEWVHNSVRKILKVNSIPIKAFYLQYHSVRKLL